MASRPLLAVDIDGVISLFGFEQPPEDARVKFELIDGMVHCVSLAAGDRLRRLAEVYELVWASGWEDRANESLPAILGLPELETIRFDGAARFGTSHWKLGPLADLAGSRPLAWIDDSLEPDCYDWARARQERDIPTLLVPTESHRGLEEAHTEALLSWADGLATHST